MSAADQATADLKAAHPDAKLVHITHEAAGASFVLAIPPESPWHELLPAWQTTRIVTPQPEAA
jgi:hypothetical protein